ncbi:MAG: TSUP family transporter, partial [Saprospiraceae bacterium]
MEFSIVLLLVVLIAFLYSAVGHGGASGYLALMVLLGYSPMYLKSTALLMNIVVSGIAFYQFYRAGFFKKDLFLPFTFLSIPMAYLGSRLPLSESHFKIILGFCLLIS